MANKKMAKRTVIKEQRMVYETRHRKLKIKQHEHTLEPSRKQPRNRQNHRGVQRATCYM